MGNFYPSAASSRGRGAGYALAAFSAVLFSCKGVLVKIAYGDGAVEVDAITLLALRMLFSLPFYAAAGVLAWKARSRSRGPAWRPALQAAFVGLLGYYVASYLDFEGLRYLTAQFERLILLTYPFFVMLLGALFFGAALTWHGLAALVLTYGGVIVVYATGATAKGDHAAFGFALVLGAAFSYALYQLLAKPLVMRMGAQLFTSIAMSAAGLGVLIHFAAVNSASSLLDAPARVVGLAALMAIAATVAPSFMLSLALERVGTQAVSMMAALGPAATIVIAVAALGEPFALADALGTLTIIAGVGLHTWRDSQERPESGS